MLDAYEAHKIRVEEAFTEEVEDALEVLDWLVRSAAMDGRAWVRYKDDSPELLYRISGRLEELHYDVQHECGAIVIRW